jgi:superfamily II DNA or RNA helicase
MKITVINPIYSKVEKQYYNTLKNLLSYEAVFYRVKKGDYRKTRKVYPKRMISTDGVFLTGFLPKVKDFLDKSAISYTIEYFQAYLEQQESVNYPKSPYLSNKVEAHENWPHQVPLIQTAVHEKRGVIQAPTGIGKTVMAAGIISCFRNKKVLFLCHTISLLTQTAKEFSTWFPSIGMIYKDSKQYDCDITVSTMQTMGKLVDDNTIDLLPKYDIIIVDEAHHVATNAGLYAKILGKLDAPIRIGLTATIPTEDEAALTLEGYIGPVIDSMTMDEGMEKGLLAKVQMRIIQSKTDHNVKALNRYPDVYDAGVVFNKSKHWLIATTTKEYTDINKSVLIIVSRIDHGKELETVCRLRGIDALFVYGHTEDADREIIKQELTSKNRLCVISSAIWREGINIPSLDVVFYVAEGKSDIATLQAIGRGLRKTTEKEVVILIDIFDDSHYFLISHFGKRLCVYMDAGFFNVSH